MWNGTHAHHLNSFAIFRGALSVPGPIRRPALPHNRGYRALLHALSRLDVLRIPPGIREGLLALRAVEEPSRRALTSTGLGHRHVTVARRVPFIAALAGLLSQEPPAAASAIPDDAETGDE